MRRRHLLPTAALLALATLAHAWEQDALETLSLAGTLAGPQPARVVLDVTCAAPGAPEPLAIGLSVAGAVGDPAAAALPVSWSVDGGWPLRAAWDHRVDRVTDATRLAAPSELVDALVRDLRGGERVEVAFGDGADAPRVTLAVAGFADASRSLRCGGAVPADPVVVPNAAPAALAGSLADLAVAGATVTLPAGEVVLDRGVLVQGDLTVVGAGAHATVVRFTGDDATQINAFEARGGTLTLRGVTLDVGGRAANGVVVIEGALQLEDVAIVGAARRAAAGEAPAFGGSAVAVSDARVRATRLRVDGVAHHGVLAIGASELDLIDAVVARSGGSGVSTSETVVALRLDGGAFEDNGGWGVASRALATEVVGSVVQGNGGGGLSLQAGSARVERAVVEGNGGFGLEVTGEAGGRIVDSVVAWNASTGVRATTTGTLELRGGRLVGNGGFGVSRNDVGASPTVADDVAMAGNVLGRVNYAAPGSLSERLRAGGTVVLPAGVHVIDVWIGLGDTALTLVGAGSGATIVRVVAPEQNGLEVAGGRLELRGLTLDGVGLAANLVVATDAETLLDDVVLRGTRVAHDGGEVVRGGHGLYVEGGTATLRRVVAAANEFDGVALRGDAAADVVDVAAVDNGRWGLSVGEGVMRVDVRGGRFDGNGRFGLAASTLGEVRVDGAAFVGNGLSGAVFDQAGAPRLTRVTARANGESGLLFDIGSRGEVLDSQLVANGQDGVAAQGGAVVRVERSELRDNARYGVYVQSAAGVDGLGNVLEGNGDGDANVELAITFGVPSPWGSGDGYAVVTTADVASFGLTCWDGGLTIGVLQARGTTLWPVLGRAVELRFLDGSGEAGTLPVKPFTYTDSFYVDDTRFVAWLVEQVAAGRPFALAILYDDGTRQDVLAPQVGDRAAVALRAAVTGCGGG